MDLALGAVGAGIGSIFPGGAMIGWAIGTTVGGAISALTMRQPEQQVGRLDDLKLTFSSNAAAIPQVWGTMRLGGNVIWATDLQESVTTSGGKGKPKVSRYSYSLSCAVLICAGEMNAVKRIWAEDRIIYDSSASPMTRETIRVYLGTESQTPDSLMEAALGSGNVPAYRGSCYVVFENLDLTPFGNRMPNFSFEVEQSASATMATVIESVATQVGIDAGQLDVTTATDAVSGYVLSGRSAARNALEPLLRVYAADLIEADGELKVVKRGGASVAKVAEDELGAASGTSGGSRYETKRTPEVELPTRLDMVYLSAGKQYQQQTQGAVRHTKVHLQDATTVTYPGALGDDVARQVAERELYTLWREREGYQFLLPPKYQYCLPADVLTIPVAGFDRRLRIEEMNLAPFGEVAISCVLDDSDVLLQVASGAAQTASSPTATAAIPTTFLAFSAGAGGDAIELRDEDETAAGFYVVGGGTAGWNGAAIYWSPDSGVTWLPGGVLTEASAVGVSVGTLANYAGTGFDTTNTVNVTLSVGILEPASQSEVQYGLNQAILGNEVLGFSGASLVSGTTWTISTLLRKLRNTLGTGHAGGDRFAVVDNAVRVTVPDSLMGATIDVRVVSPYQSIGDAAVIAAEQTITIGTKTGPPWVSASTVVSSLAESGSTPLVGAVTVTGSGGIVATQSGQNIDFDGSGITVASPLTTKGDLYTFDTADERLPIGADGEVLTADSGEPTGLKWVAPSGGAGSLVILKQTINYTDVNATLATNNTFNLPIQLPAGSVVVSTKLKHSVAWAGSGVGTVSSSVRIYDYETGTNVSLNGLVVSSTVSPSNLSSAYTSFGVYHLLPQDINILISASGTGLNNLTAGSLDIWVAYYVAL